ncbi:hypothetical protein QL093DRAFT_2459947 [Fusarium oxysporum]|nr:hypothetical protein QL093DRAFT_2459947 [Fusarium oxysporum]
MRFTTSITYIMLSATVALAVPSEKRNVEADELIVRGLELRGTCCTCPNGQAGCGGYCYSNCPQCIWNKC